MSDRSTTRILTATTRLALLLFLCVIESIYGQFVNTQLFQSLVFGATTPQVRIKGNIAPYSATKAYTLWGWFRFDGETTAISNILTLRNKSTSTPATSTAVNSNYPACPVTSEQVQINPNIVTQPGIADNPNCASVISSNGSANQSQDILYINYDLGEIIDSTQKYSLIFLIQAGIDSSTGKSDMKIDGFVNLNFKRNIWAFFAISCDYSMGQSTLFFQEYGTQTPASSKSVSLSFQNFALLDSPELIIAGVENNPYFQSTSGFIGNIAYIEMAPFYTSDLAFMWVGFMSQAAYGSKGVVLEFFFDLYDSNSIKSQGSVQKSFEVTGTTSAVFSSNRNKVGVSFKEGSKIDLQQLSFSNSEGTRSMAFYLQFEYAETLPDEFYIFRRGLSNTNGYLAISLIRSEGDKRRIKLYAKGEVSNATWKSDRSDFVKNRMYKIIIGISISVSNDIVLSYWDLDSIFETTLLQKNFIFDMGAKDALLIGNQELAGYDGSFTFYRFIALNSASAALQRKYTPSTTATRSANASVNTNCVFRTSFFTMDNDCLICKNSIATYDRKCADFCPYGFKNATSDVCLKCFKPDCSEIEQTSWQTKLVNDQTYRIEPTRKLLGSPNLDSIFEIQFDQGVGASGFNYTMTPNNKDQYIDLVLDLKANLINQTLKVVPKNSTDVNNFYDANRNLLSPNATKIVVDRTCYVGDSTKSVMRGLAWFVIVLFFLSFLILLLVTIFFCSKFDDLGTVWKFFLHNCIKFQFVALLLLTGIYMPCCVKEFMNIIFKIFISWDTALSPHIHSSNAASEEYMKVLRANQVPRSFAEQGLQNYLLHNMGVLFIINLIIFLIYVGFKIWDVCARGKRATIMYRLFILVELTMVISGYAFTLPQATTFEFLNFRFPSFVPSYFGFCFVLSLIYLLVFVVFWFYASFRICRSKEYFMDIINYNKFYYFFAGYKETKLSQSYDLCFHMVFFVSCLCIGAIFDSPVAQLTIIFIAILALLIISLTARPWVYLFQFFVEIVSQVFLLIAVIILLVIASYDKSGCYTCGDREGSLCYIIVLCLFIYFSLLSIGLIAQTLLMKYASNRFYAFGRKKELAENEIENLKRSHRSMFESTARESKINDSNQPLIPDLSQRNNNIFAKGFNAVQYNSQAPMQDGFRVDAEMNRFNEQSNFNYDSNLQQQHGVSLNEQTNDRQNYDLHYQRNNLTALQMDQSNAQAEFQNMRKDDSEHEFVRGGIKPYGGINTATTTLNKAKNAAIESEKWNGRINVEMNEQENREGVDRQTFSRYGEFAFEEHGQNNMRAEAINQNEKHTMDQFMHELKKQRYVESDITMVNTQVDSWTNLLKNTSVNYGYEDNRAFQKKNFANDTVREATILMIDDIDEADIQPSLLKALSAHNKSIDLDDNRSDLYQKRKYVSRKKEQFYRSRSQENIDPNRGPKVTSIGEESSIYQAGHGFDLDRYKKLNIQDDNSVMNDDISLYSNNTRILSDANKVFNLQQRINSVKDQQLFFGSRIEEKPFGVDSFASSNRFN
jgi:hypothetical protein